MLGKQKVFCVGFSKTGTTSLEEALNMLGYKTWHGHWQNPNMSYIMSLYLHQDYEELFRIINYYDAFADAPWGGSNLYIELYRRFPQSKFILSIRTPESWYVSLEKMLTTFSPNNLSEAFSTFHSNGRYGIVHFFEKIFDITTLEGNKSKIIDYYIQYNQGVIDFFKDRDVDFLVFNLEVEKKWELLCPFLDKLIPSESFPHANQSLVKQEIIKVVQAQYDSVSSIDAEIKAPNKHGSSLSTISKLYRYFSYSIGFVSQFPSILLLSLSRLFDGDWYLSNNPDLLDTKISPVWHYLRFGGFEGRNPSLNFNSRWYLDAYQDVAQSGSNPLVHYLKHGKAEGRIPVPPLSPTLDTLTRTDNQAQTDIAGKQIFISSSSCRKIFCIGANKTGTTSLEQAFRNLGFKVGNQVEAEHLLDDWAIRDFKRIVEHCQTADAFQDVPFSLDFTYQVLDYVFPGSKFVLTIRNNSEEWYQSLVRFHSNLLGLDRIPTADDLRKFVYHEEGYLLKHQLNIYGVEEETLYDKEIYKAFYQNHNASILKYFKFRPDDLLVLNLGEASAMEKLCDFLDVEYTDQVMPHLNQSALG